MKCNSYHSFFDAISNRTRMCIVESLLKSPKSVGELSEDLGEEQSNISHNLKTLATCRFISSKREGKKKIYSLNEETVVPILKLVDKHVSSYCNKECCQRK
jgi:DNA-binding transcriptional ArsR family regulator